MNTLISNILINASTCIQIYDTQNSNFINNTLRNCNTGIGFWAGGDFYNNFINNTIEFSSNAGIWLDWSSSYNYFYGNKFNNNFYGIVHQSQWYGTSLNNTIVGNEFKGNTYGLMLGDSYWFNISDNQIFGNAEGIWMTNSFNNTIYHNNFINNTNHQVYDDFSKTNSWNIIGEGNYFSNYDTPPEGCVDLNCDGICDNPYVIRGENKDNFAFVNQSGWLLNRSSGCACPYTVRNFVNNLGQLEHQFNYSSQHFLTVIESNNVNGDIFDIRPHPGLDPDGWGSSFYLQPFFPGAFLNYSKVNNYGVTCNGIYVNASGNVSLGNPSTKYGTWKTNLFFTYNPNTKEINGNGKYSIDLLGTMSSAGGDLNLYKIASNYLVDVPLLNKSTGDTGDMKYANVTGTSYPSLLWIPDTGSTFPGAQTNSLSIDVVGDYNQVNTSAMGYGYSIKPAYKPGIKVVLTGNPTSFGGFYADSLKKDFTQDNVGITPWIAKASTSETHFNYNVSFYAYTIQGDGSPKVLALSAPVNTVNSSVINNTTNDTKKNNPPKKEVKPTPPKVTPPKKTEPKKEIKPTPVKDIKPITTKPVKTPVVKLTVGKSKQEVVWLDKNQKKK